MNKREARYRDKINFVTGKIESIPTSDLEGDIVKDAVLYKIQVGIEGVVDIAAMLVKDTGKDVGDDYYNIGLLKEAGIISLEMCDKLKRLNGLRNIIVHRYNGIEEDLIFGNLDEIKKDIYDFIKIVENVIKNYNFK